MNPEALRRLVEWAEGSEDRSFVFNVQRSKKDGSLWYNIDIREYTPGGITYTEGTFIWEKTYDSMGPVILMIDRLAAKVKEGLEPPDKYRGPKPDHAVRRWVPK